MRRRVHTSTSRDIFRSTMKTRFIAVISTTRLDISTFPPACVFNIDDRIRGIPRCPMAQSDGLWGRDELRVCYVGVSRSVSGPIRGRARQREMKFDRSAPHIHACVPLCLFFFQFLALLASSADSSANKLSLAVWSISLGSLRCKMAFLAPPGCPTGIRTPPAFSRGAPLFRAGSWGPYTPFYTILFYLPLPCRRLRSLGAQFKRASLVPSRHLFTNTSHDLLALCPFSSRLFSSRRGFARIVGAIFD